MGSYVLTTDSFDLAMADPDVFRLRHEDEDELEPSPALPFDDHSDGTAEEEMAVPTTAEEYLRMVWLISILRSPSCPCCLRQCTVLKSCTMLPQVRRQARKVPDVVSRAIDPSKIRAPTVRFDYEDISTCNEQLVSDVAWEKSFMPEFLDLRSQLQRARLSGRMQSPNVRLPSTKNHKAWQNVCFGENALPPSLDLVIHMDSATVNQILWIFSHLFQEHVSCGMQPPLDCQAECWLFSMLAVTDKPTDPDTSAALRSILRCLCSIRAKLNSPRDSCLPAVNILISIIGTFFGQLPSRFNAADAKNADANEQDEDEEDYDEDDECCDGGEDDGAQSPIESEGDSRS